MVSIPAVKTFIKFVINYGGQRRAIGRDYLFRLAARLTPVIAVDSRGVRYYLSTKDEDLSRWIFTRGYYEEPLMKNALDVICGLNGGEPNLNDAIFLDVGANIGTATLAAMCRFGAERTVAFEPDPGNFELLQHNLLANDLTDRVSLFPVAISDRQGDVELHISPSHPGCHRVLVPHTTTVNSLAKARQGTRRVPATTLDRVTDDERIDLRRVGLVWIDTEGHEAHVLAGARKLLSTDVPVMIEVWPWALRAAHSLDRFVTLVVDNYTHVVDMGARRQVGTLALRPASEIASLIEIYDRSSTDLQYDSSSTDVLLLKR